MPGRHRLTKSMIRRGYPLPNRGRATVGQRQLRGGHMEIPPAQQLCPRVARGGLSAPPWVLQGRVFALGRWEQIWLLRQEACTWFPHPGVLRRLSDGQCRCLKHRRRRASGAVTSSWRWQGCGHRQKGVAPADWAFCPRHIDRNGRVLHWVPNPVAASWRKPLDLAHARSGRGDVEAYGSGRLINFPTLKSRLRLGFSLHGRQTDQAGRQHSWCTLPLGGGPCCPYAKLEVPHPGDGDRS